MKLFVVWLIFLLFISTKKKTLIIVITCFKELWGKQPKVILTVFEN